MTEYCRPMTSHKYYHTVYLLQSTISCQLENHETGNDNINGVRWVSMRLIGRKVCLQYSQLTKRGLWNRQVL